MKRNDWIISMPYNKVSPSEVQHHSSSYNEFLRQAPKDNSIFKDIRTVLFILKVTGLLPIYEEVSSYELGPPSKPNIFYSFLIRGVVQAFTIFNLYNLLTPGSAQLFYSYSDTDNVNKWIEFLLCMLAHTATVIICARNSKSFLKIFNEILKVDEDVLVQFGATLENKCDFALKFIVGICICQWYLMILRVLDAEDPLTVNSYIFFVFNAVQNGMATVFIVFAAALLRIVKVRFAHLNSILEGYSYTQQPKLRRLARRGGNGPTMDTFPEDSLFTYRMHNKLLRIYRSINDCCSLILVAYMGYAFYTITTTTYNLFVQITTQRHISLKVLQFCFAWLAMHTCVLALLSRSCGQATDEFPYIDILRGQRYLLPEEAVDVFLKYRLQCGKNATPIDLSNIEGIMTFYQQASDVDKFLTKSIKQEVQFTAYGFFVIDNSTLFKIFSAVTTYLVILIQFKQLEDSKSDDETT